MSKNIKSDCFAYDKNLGRCKALNEISCNECHFYKASGTECKTCKHFKKDSCIDIEMAACYERRKNRA